MKRSGRMERLASGDDSLLGTGRAEGYFARSRHIAVGFLAILPLLAIYEAGIVIARAPVVNGADALLRRGFGVLGPEAGRLGWWLVLALCAAAAIAVVVRRRFPFGRDLACITGEGLAWGAVLGPVALFVQSKVAPFLSTAAAGHGLFLDSVLSVGAGVYEEIVFRLLLLPGLYVLVRRASATLEASPVAALLVAVLLSSLLFSGFHHWPDGEPFVARVFLFRTIAGCVLAALFVARGLGIAVYTHAAYDLFVTFQNR